MFRFVYTTLGWKHSVLRVFKNSLVFVIIQLIYYKNIGFPRNINVALPHFLCLSSQAFVYLNIYLSILNKLQIGL